MLQKASNSFGLSDIPENQQQVDTYYAGEQVQAPKLNVNQRLDMRRDQKREQYSHRVATVSPSLYTTSRTVDLKDIDKGIHHGSWSGQNRKLVIGLGERLPSHHSERFRSVGLDRVRPTGLVHQDNGERFR